MKLATRIKKFKKQTGLPYYKIADAAGVSRPVIYRAVKGKDILSSSYRKLMAVVERAA